MTTHTQLQSSGIITDPNLVGLDAKLRWDRDFSLDFENVVPAFYTNILLVEDDKVTQSYLKSILKRSVRSPVRVRSFSSAEKAGEYIHSLEKFQLPGPDYAVIDYLLSGSADGLWLCKMLEKKYPETQSILISNTDKEILTHKMEEYNVKPYFIQKPVGPLSLFSYMEK